MDLLTRLRREYVPLLDPPGRDTVWDGRRNLTRDRTPHDPDIPDEYVVTVHAEPERLRVALEDVGYRNNQLSTLKYVTPRRGGLSWEQGTYAAGKFAGRGEVMQHAYWFLARDGSIHVHHHREWPLSRPRKHWNASRTHGDPDDSLVDALESAGIAYDRRTEPEYAAVEP